VPLQLLNSCSILSLPLNCTVGGTTATAENPLLVHTKLCICAKLQVIRALQPNALHCGNKHGASSAATLHASIERAAERIQDRSLSSQQRPWSTCLNQSISDATLHLQSLCFCLLGGPLLCSTATPLPLVTSSFHRPGLGGPGRSCIIAFALFCHSKSIVIFSLCSSVAAGSLCSLSFDRP
jgi:hypothetical protein